MRMDLFSFFLIKDLFYFKYMPAYVRLNMFVQVLAEARR